MPHPSEFANVTAVAKANVFFDGKVVSHVIRLADGSRKSLGLIYPGQYHFDTKEPERMDITAGSCRVRLAGQETWQDYTAGGSFKVAAGAGFDIAVDGGIAEYVCSFG